MKSNIKIIIVDDQKLFINGLKSLLNVVPTLTVIGVAENGKELLELLKVLEPDLIILDVDMPVMNGHETMEILAKNFSYLKVVVLSMHYDPYHVSEFLKLGASAYFPKNVDFEILINAIEIINIEGQYIDSKTSELLISSLSYDIKKDSVVGQKMLDKIEIEILKLICYGKIGKEIADHLSISIDTLNFHKKNIKIKTNCHSIAELVFYALKHGVLPLN